MASSRQSESERRITSGRQLPFPLLLSALLVSGGLVSLQDGSISGTSFAAEATKRGRNADVRWVEPDGTVRDAAGKEIRYVHHERTMLSVPRKGRSFKDRTRENRGIPISRNFISFSQCDRIEFDREVDGRGNSVLLLRIHLVDGEIVEARGPELAGADHPESPWLEFSVDRKKVRIPLHPIAAEGTVAGQRRIRSLVFTL